MPKNGWKSKNLQFPHWDSASIFVLVTKRKLLHIWLQHANFIIYELCWRYTANPKPLKPSTTSSSLQNRDCRNYVGVRILHDPTYRFSILSDHHYFWCSSTNVILHISFLRVESTIEKYELGLLSWVLNTVWVCH